MAPYVEWFFVAVAARLGWYATELLIQQAEYITSKLFTRKDEYRFVPGR